MARSMLSPFGSVQTTTRSIDFSSVFESLPTACAVLTADLTIVAVTDAYVRMLETQREELLDRRIVDAFPTGPDAPVLADSLARARGGAPHTIALEPRRATWERRGRTAPVWRVTHAPVRRDDGSVRYVMQTIDDVTEEMAAIELQVTEAMEVEMAGRFVAEIARELESSSTTFLGEVASLPEELLKTSGAQHVLDAARRMSTRAVAVRLRLADVLHRAR